MPVAHRFHLGDHTAAFETPFHQFAQTCRVIKGAAVNQVFDMGDKQPVGQIAFGPDRAIVFDVALGCIDAQRVVGQFFDHQPPLFGAIKGDGDVGFALGQGKGTRQRHQLDHQIGMPGGKAREFTGQKIVAKPVGHTNAYGSGDAFCPAGEGGADFKEG